MGLTDLQLHRNQWRDQAWSKAREGRRLTYRRCASTAAKPKQKSVVWNQMMTAASQTLMWNLKMRTSTASSPSASTSWWRRRPTWRRRRCCSSTPGVRLTLGRRWWRATSTLQRTGPTFPRPGWGWAADSFGKKWRFEIAIISLIREKNRWAGHETMLISKAPTGALYIMMVCWKITWRWDINQPTQSQPHPRPFLQFWKGFWIWTQQLAFFWNDDDVAAISLYFLFSRLNPSDYSQIGLWCSQKVRHSARWWILVLSLPFCPMKNVFPGWNSFKSTNVKLPWINASFDRERYLSATCTLDMIDDVSQDALFRVLRQRLGYINVLPYIVAFNQKTADEQLNFMLADDDRKQWQVCESQPFCIVCVLKSLKTNHN